MPQHVPEQPKKPEKKKKIFNFAESKELRNRGKLGQRIVKMRRQVPAHREEREQGATSK